jgi:predicted nucleic acid-binding protein
MDDGEAQTLAIAVHRSIPILSDDLAVERAVSELSVPLETSLDLLAAWQAGGVRIEEVAGAAQRMRALANYAPPRNHPKRAWYARLIGTSRE